MDFFSVSKLCYSFAALIIALQVAPMNHVPSIVCAIGGIVGGAITQCLTLDYRRPTRKVIVGEMMASGVCGFAAYAAPEIAAQSTGIMLPAALSGVTSPVVLASIIMGGASQWVWYKLIGPKSKNKGGEHGDD